jgi:hypothetical protein
MPTISREIARESLMARAREILEQFRNPPPTTEGQDDGNDR